MSIVDTFHKVAPKAPAPPDGSREWWLSDAGKDRRCAEYIAIMLYHKWHPVITNAAFTNYVVPKSDDEPKWPAIEWYYIGTDEILWLRCETPIWLKDFARAYPNRLNKAAREILNQMEIPK